MLWKKKSKVFPSPADCLKYSFQTHANYELLKFDFARVRPVPAYDRFFGLQIHFEAIRRTWTEARRLPQVFPSSGARPPSAEPHPCRSVQSTVTARPVD